VQTSTYIIVRLLFLVIITVLAQVVILIIFVVVKSILVDVFEFLEGQRLAGEPVDSPGDQFLLDILAKLVV
jgi:hypothetical protein